MAETAPVPHPHLYNLTANHIFKRILVHYGGVTAHQVDNSLQQLPGPYILAPVHRSMLDIPVVSYSANKIDKTQAHFMAKPELWKIPGLGPFIAKCGAFMVDRGEALPAEKIAHIQGIIQKGGVLGIFPEGTRCVANEIQRKDLKRSVAAIALKFNTPVVPVGITGTAEENRGPIHVVYGEPISWEADGDIDLNNPRTYVRETRPKMDEPHAALTQVQQLAIDYQAHY